MIYLLSARTLDSIYILEVEVIIKLTFDFSQRSKKNNGPAGLIKKKYLVLTLMIMKLIFC